MRLLRKKSKHIGALFAPVVFAGSLLGCGGGLNGVYFDPNELPKAPNIVSGDVPDRTRSWHFRALGYDKAKEFGLTGKDVLVGLIDTGIDADHPLVSHLVHEDSIRIFDGVYYPNYQDFEGHGTAMASLIAGGNYATGLLTGIAPEAGILVVAANDMNGDISTFQNSDLALAIRYATDRNVQVISYSIGGYGGYYDPDVRAIDYATDNGVIVVMATGNDGFRSETSSPARFAGSPRFSDLGLAIYALDETGDMADFSTTCRDVWDHKFCLGVPGEDLLQAELTLGNEDGALGYGSGTSQATAVAAGSVAIMLELFPETDPEKIVEILYLTADDLGRVGVDRIYGSGALNLERAVMPLGKTRLSNSTPIELNSRIIQTSSAMGSSLKNTEALKNLELFDEYDRVYGLDLTKAIQENKDFFEFEDDEFQSQIGLKYNGIKNQFIDYFGLEYGDLARAQDAASSLYQVDSTANANPFADGLDLELAIGSEGGILPYEFRLATNSDEGSDQLFAQLHGYRYFGNWRLGAGLSFHQGNQQVLGTYFPSAVAGVDKTITQSLHMSAEYDRNEFIAFLRGSYGFSDVTMKHQNGIFTDFENVEVSSFAMGLAWRDLAVNGDRIDFAVSQSMRIESGHANTNPMLVSQPIANLQPNARELTFELGYLAPITPSFDVKASAVYQHNPGHNKGMDAQAGASLRLQYKF